MMAKRDAQISFRTNMELKTRLEKQARKERLSVSGLIVKVMEEYLRSRQEEQ